MTEIDLSPRMREVVILVGRDRLSYKAVAKSLEKQDGEGTLSPHTVRSYAEQIRDRMGVEIGPRDACTRYYWRHREALEEQSSAA